MDVQMENTDPPPAESQPSGKIRKGFKLFGKRKPGNIFSIRGKGDGNNKSPVIGNKTLEGLSEAPAPDSEPEPDKEKAQEVSQGEREQAEQAEEEEPLSDDGVLAAAPARTSISSASSAKSLSFLSLLRGGRRGAGDRRAQTVCQPAGRQRRGLKGLFGSVKFRSKDKEDREEAPPSPLLMSSRANSVEIIKEDLPLTPKSQPRSLDSPGTQSGEPLQSLTEQDSPAASPSKTTGDAGKTNEHVPALSTPEPPMMPGDNSLSSLLADISSLLTFDSISGGDIMADVEAEWGKASSAPGASVTDVTPSSASPFSKPLTSFSSAAPVKVSPVATAAKASSQPPTRTTATSSPVSKPSSIITTFTKSSTLTTQSVKLSSDFTPASESIASGKPSSNPAAAATKPSSTPVTLTSFSTPATSSLWMTPKSATSTISTAPLVELPSVGPGISSTFNRLASERAAPPTMTSFVSKPSPVATPAPPSYKPPPVTHSLPISVTPTQPPPDKLELTSTFKTSNSYKPSLSLFEVESKASTVASTCPVTTKPSSTAPASTSKMTAFPTSTPTSSSVSVTTSKPALFPVDLNKTSSSLVPDPSSSRPLPAPASVPTSTSAPSDKTSPATKPTSPPAPSDKTLLTSKPVPAPATQVGVSTASPTPAAPGQIPVSQSHTPAAFTHVPDSVSKELPAPTQTQVTQSKAAPSLTQVPVSVSKDLPVSTPLQVSQSKSPLPPAQIPVSVSKAPPASTLTAASGASHPPASLSVPISVSKDIPAPTQTPVSQSEAPPAAPAPRPVTSPLSPPAPGLCSVRGVQPASIKTEEQPNETQTSLHGSSREKKPAQAKSSGLSKIPIVGGGRTVKPPVRDGQHGDDERVKDPPTPVSEEEKPYFNSHNAGSKDRTGATEARSPTSKLSPEESPQQAKVVAGSGRDSKIPVKHGAAPASQIPQAKEPTRTKIPVSKVPVRRAGTKPAATGSTTQIRK